MSPAGVPLALRRRALRAHLLGRPSREQLVTRVGLGLGPGVRVMALGLGLGSRVSVNPNPNPNPSSSPIPTPTPTPNPNQVARNILPADGDALGLAAQHAPPLLLPPPHEVVGYQVGPAAVPQP